MEQKWDSLLTAGRKIYGVSSDDAHEFKTWSLDVSNPGRGWVMVQSEQLTRDAITDAMAAGKFYSTSGVMLSVVKIDNENYEISIDEDATYRATESPYVVGYKSEERKDGFWIEFISDEGKVVKTTEGTSASMKVTEGVKYLRAKMTFSRVRGNGSEQFFAWTQPVFLD